MEFIFIIFPVQSLRTTAAEKVEELGLTLQELTNKKRATDGVYQDALKRNKELKVSTYPFDSISLKTNLTFYHISPFIQDNLRNNEAYRQISHLEDKLSDILKENKILHDALEQLKKEFVYEEVKTQALDRVNDYNQMLCSDTFVN